MFLFFDTVFESFCQIKKDPASGSPFFCIVRRSYSNLPVNMLILRKCLICKILLYPQKYPQGQRLRRGSYRLSLCRVSTPTTFLNNPGKGCVAGSFVHPVHPDVIQEFRGNKPPQPQHPIPYQKSHGVMRPSDHGIDHARGIGYQG